MLKRQILSNHVISTVGLIKIYNHKWETLVVNGFKGNVNIFFCQIGAQSYEIWCLLIYCYVYLCSIEFTLRKCGNAYNKMIVVIESSITILVLHVLFITFIYLVLGLLLCLYVKSGCSSATPAAPCASEHNMMHLSCVWSPSVTLKSTTYIMILLLFIIYWCLYCLYENARN